MNVFVFDIETVPDVQAGRRVYSLDGLSDEQVAEVMVNKQREHNGQGFLRHHFHRVVAISVALRTGDRFKLWSLAQPDSPEKELISRFFDGIERYTPTIVSWNGAGFDLPVLHYRALLHGVSAPKYWQTGDETGDFRWNNYQHRYHQRHTDLMDLLSGYQARARASLDHMATLLGFPGKLGMSGADVWGHYREGKVDDIRNYCETDVLNTYLIFLRFELMRGRLSSDDYDIECENVRSSLAVEDKPHLKDFLRTWAGG